MAQGQVRIIGGQWRGRKLKVPNVPNLRPTPDRVRETLFNWLSSTILGARCLDPFAGSGALGFEALSRGAAHVTMIDQSREVVTLLREEAAMLKAENIEIYAANVPKQIKPVEKPFNVVFLDPPFHENLLLPTCFYLEEQGFLEDDAWIYLEAKEALQEVDLPKNWTPIKNKVAGQVAYHLFRREKALLPK